MSNFMERQITGLETWLQVVTGHGTEFVRLAGLSLFVRDSNTLTHPMTADERWATVTKIQPYVGGEPESWEHIKGYGARLSAPGYLDCTEWAVFDSEDEARQYLEELDEDEPEND